MKLFKINFQVTQNNNTHNIFKFDNKRNIWYLESSSDSVEVSNHWKEIEDKISIFKDTLINISKVYIISFDEERLPPIDFSSNMLQFIADIHADIIITSQNDFNDEYIMNNSDFTKNNTLNSPIKGEGIPDDFFKKEE